MASFNQSLQTEVVAGQSIDYVYVFGTERWCGVWGGVFNEITVWWLFKTPSQAQSFINEQRSCHELADGSNNECICCPAEKKKSLLTSLTPQNSNWKELLMLLLILLAHSLEGCLNVTHPWLSLADWGFVKHQMCGAPVAGRQHWREGPAASRTVDLVRADTDARGHTGRSLCGSHFYTNTHTRAHTHLGTEAAAKCHCAEVSLKASCCLAVTDSPVYPCILAAELYWWGRGWLRVWLPCLNLKL